MSRVENTGARALGDAIAGLLEAPAQMAAAFAGALTKRTSGGCEIPAPCWEPQPAGTCCLDILPGCVGKIRVHVTNCHWSRQVVLVTAMGRLAGWMQLNPTTLVVDPQERRTVEVTVRIPEDTKPGQTFTGPLVILGCRDHYVRVEINVTECAAHTVCDAFIDDCPDHVHHWYDHFYCPRPCRQIDPRKHRRG